MTNSDDLMTRQKAIDQAKKEREFVKNILERLIAEVKILTNEEKKKFLVEAQSAFAEDDKQKIEEIKNKIINLITEK